MCEIKNPLRLVNITKRVKEFYPQISVAVFGSGELLEECKAKSEKLNLSNNITFFGFKSDFYGYLKKSKILIMTSKTEGIPMSILEAQTFGLPIISTKINGLERIIVTNKSGYMYESDDEAVNYILSLLNDDKKYNEMKSYITDFSVKYNDVKAYKETINNIYKGEY